MKNITFVIDSRGPGFPFGQFQDPAGKPVQPPAGLFVKSKKTFPSLVRGVAKKFQFWWEKYLS